MKTKVVIITQIRSGTQMLYSALEQHPSVGIQSWPPENCNGLWFQLSKFQNDSRKNAVITVTHQWGNRFIAECAKTGTAKFWEGVKNHHNKFIFLKRENQLECFLSHKLSEIYGIDVQEHPDEKEPLNPIRLDMREFMGFVTAYYEYRSLAEECFANILSLTYEQLLYDWDYTINSVQSYIGITPMKLEPTTHKQEVKPIRELITNYDEVRKFLIEYNWIDWLK